MQNPRARKTASACSSRMMAVLARILVGEEIRGRRPSNLRMLFGKREAVSARRRDAVNKGAHPFVGLPDVVARSRSMAGQRAKGSGPKRGGLIGVCQRSRAHLNRAVL